MNMGKELTIDVKANTDGLDEAIDKVGELSELIADMAPQVSIRNCRGCTFNIYPSRTVFMDDRMD